MASLVPVILAGGARGRESSRNPLPRQYVRLASERSLFQETLLRARSLPGAQPPVVVCGADHRAVVREQLAGAGVEPGAILVEPVSRNTAPALAVAALLVQERFPGALLLALPSDHVVRDVAGFVVGIERALPLARDGAIAAFGIVPAWAETAYGYIEIGAALAEAERLYRVGRFVEKPSHEQAREFAASGRHLWNGGMLLARADVLLAELAALAPDVLGASRAALALARDEGDSLLLEETAFASSPSIAIDYAVMEKTARAAVAIVDAGWSDLGSSGAPWGGAANDASAVGAPPSRRRDSRPWGHFERVDCGERFQVKRITVVPGGKLSLQLHRHRAEHWVVVKGTARVTRGELVLQMSADESIYIPKGMRHRLENDGPEPLEVIEVQTGGYLGEDDIERFQDAYERT